MKYIYDSQGQVEAVEYNSETYQLDNAERMQMPGREVRKVHSFQSAINSTVEDIKDSYVRDGLSANDSSIMVAIEATHGGYYNDNMYKYRFSGMQEMVDTWTANGGRPYILMHDMRSEPRGRVVDARAVSTRAGMGYQDLETRIGHPEEIEMILDKRALHVSAGTRPVDTTKCRICGHDLYKEGNTPKRYTLDSMPSPEVLKQKAPGFFGKMLDMDNEEYWDVQEDDEGKVTGLCRHVRHFEAPMGGDDTLKTGWEFYANKAREISRVNAPADINEETGEYAHIREVITEVEDMAPEAADRYITDSLATINDGQGKVARANIARESDLWRPGTEQEATSFAEDHSFDCMFNVSLWNTINDFHSGKSMDDRVSLYWQEGGKFIDKQQAFGEDPVTLSEALDYDNASEFGDWLRAQDFSRSEKQMIDKLYTRRYIKQLKQGK